MPDADADADIAEGHDAAARLIIDADATTHYLPMLTP